MPDAPASATLIDPLRRYLQRHSALQVEVIETHISWPLLADATAYKIKKAIALPFLDFTSLEARRHFCEEELRLNRRLAWPLYLGVSRITGSPADPAIDGDGPAIDYAVRMRRFPPGSLLADHAAAGTLRAADIDRLAERLAAFHAGAPLAEPGSGFGSAERRTAVALGALDAVGALAPPRAGDCSALRGWLCREAAALAPRWSARQTGGFVREGHGDLHLANLLLLDDEVAAFDGIEFDPALRWIDIVDAAAFVAMDLLAHGRRDLALRFVNAWLDAAGDHDGLPLWRFALVYRALVRAQVGLIRERQGATPAQPPGNAYLDLALRLASEPADARLLVTHGLPGLGMSFVALQIVERAGAIRLRADVERKRLFGLGALDDSRSVSPAVDLYGADATRRTYDPLAELARVALQADWPTIVDAAFLRRDERERFAALAGEMKLPYSILDCQASRRCCANASWHGARGATIRRRRTKGCCRRWPRCVYRWSTASACAIVADSARPVDAGTLAAAWRRAAEDRSGLA